MAIHKQLISVLFCALSCITAPAMADDEKAQALIARYTATWDIDEFLAEPEIANGLAALPADTREALLMNLSVTGGIEYYGGALLVRGNAPHRGTEEEAILCVQPWTAVPVVHAAIHSERRITIHSRETSYNWLPTCIKDWITEVNSQHAARLNKPPNVQLITIE